MAKILTTTYQRISTIPVTYGEIRTYAKVNSQDTDLATTSYSVKATYYLTQWVAVDGWNVELDGIPNGGDYKKFNAGETTLIEITRGMNHNPDGSSPVKNIVTTFSATFGGGGTTNADIQMPRIDRIPTISSANDFNDEGNGYVAFSNPAGFVVKPTLSFYYKGNTTNVLHSITRTSGITSPYTFTLSDAERTSLRNKLNDKKEYTVRYTLKAYNSSGTYIGEVSTDKKFTIVNAEPTFTTAFTETNSKVSSLLGTGVSSIVKNASNIKVTVTPSAKKGATIKSVEIIHGTSDVTKTASPYETTLTAISNTYKIVVTDSRGFSTTQTITKTLIDYIPIEISQYSFKRVVPTSSDIKLNATIVYKQQTFGSTANAPTLKWKKGESGTWNTIASGSYSVNTSSNKITISDLTLGGALPYTQSAKFYLSVSDLLTSDDENAAVTVGIPVYDYGEEDFQVNGDLFLADRKRQNKAPLNVSGKVSKNLIDEANIITSRYINASGQELSNEEAKIVNYIKVIPNEVYSFSANSSSSGTVRIHGYNASGVWVSQVTTVTTSSSYNKTFTIPSNVEKIRISMPIADTNIQIEKGSTATEYEEYYEPTISIRNSNGIFQETDINEFFSDEYIDIKSLVTSTGAISDLEISKAYVKKSGGMTSLKILARTNTGIPTNDISSIMYIPKEYAPSIGYSTYCRTGTNYSYPEWNGGENLAFLRIETSGYMTVRTRTTGQKVICIDLVY